MSTSPGMTFDAVDGIADSSSCHLCLDICLFMYAYIHAYMLTYMHAYIHTHTHMDTCVYPSIHVHAARKERQMDR